VCAHVALPSSTAPLHGPSPSIRENLVTTLHPLTAVTTLLPAEDPGVTSNTTGLPGLAQLREIVGALLTFGLVACVAALVIAAIVWGLGSNSSNPHLAGRGKTGVVVAAGAALLIGAANAIVTFFSGVGSLV